MSRNKNNIPYTASDIEKYRKGELSARDMHDLEQAALDDPFLADAIEGLMQHPTLQEDLIDLGERLDAKLTSDTRRNRTIIIQRQFTLAAALILLLGIGYTFFYRHADSPAKASAKATAPGPTPERATVAITTPAPAAQLPAREPKIAADSISFKNTLAESSRSTLGLRHRLPITAAKSAGNLSTELRSRDKASAYTPNQASSLTSNQVSLPSSNAATNLPSSNQATNLPSSNQASGTPSSNQATHLPLSNQASAPALQKAIIGTQKDTTAFENAMARSAVPTPLVLSGKVLDLQNHPLAGAFLALNGNPGYGFTTDDQGQFMISLHPHDSTRQLTVSMIGYDQASLAVNTLSTDYQKGNVIHLRPSTGDLDEVVVTGYGAKRKATEAAAPSVSNERLDTNWISAAPVIGRQAYLQYLSVGKKRLGLDTSITGTETVSFIVSRDGPLSSFKIEQSISPAHDAGIIRLINDGPAWHLLRGKKARASVTVNF